MEKYPESRAFTFRFKNKNPNNYFFRLEEPTFLNIGKTRSVVKCLKFHKETGYIAVTNIPINNDDEIIAYTVGTFTGLINKKISELLEDTKANMDLILQYEALGFDIPRSPLKKV